MPAGTSRPTGLFGAPPIRVLVGAKAHTTIFAALRMLGLGSRRVELVPADDQGRLRVSELARLLSFGDGPAIVVAQVGEVNTGAVIAAVQHEGTCWMSGTEWQGEPAMRISVSNWRTTEDDIRRSARAILAEVGNAARATA